MAGFSSTVLIWPVFFVIAESKPASSLPAAPGNTTISMESAAPKRSSPSRKRRRILHTCAVSMLATAGRASAKATMFRGPVGSLVNGVIGFLTTRGPFVGLFRFQTHLLLLILSFLDDRILKVENVVEDHFPASLIVFDKIDDVVCFTESLPAKLDEAIDKFSGLFEQFPPLSSGVGIIFDLVNLWDSHSASAKERDIMVDTNCNKNSHGATRRVLVCDEAVCQIEPPLTSSHITSLPEKFRLSDQAVNDQNLVQEPRKKTTEDKSEDQKEYVPKCSYKEVLERSSSNKDVLEKGTKGINIVKETTIDAGNDPILELFESAWHMT